MKYTLFFFFAFLCIIELNALNLRSKNPVKTSSKPRSNTQTKKETSNKGKNVPIKPSTPTKNPAGIIKRVTDTKEKINKFIPKTTDPKTRTTNPTTKTTHLRPRTTYPTTKTTYLRPRTTHPTTKTTYLRPRTTHPTTKTTHPTTKTTHPTTKTTHPTTKTTHPTTKTINPRKTTDLVRKKILAQIKEKLKYPMTEIEIKKMIAKMKEKTKYPITDQEIKIIINDLKLKKTTTPINKDPTMKKIINELKRKRPITDPAVQKLIEDLKKKHKISDPEMKKIIIDLKKRMKNPVMKPTVPVKQTTLPKNKNKESTQKVIDFLKSKKGCGYAYGSDGQTLTPDLLNYFQKNFGDNVKGSTSKWMGKECYDCSGLTMKALKEIGINVHHSAHYTWTEDMKQKGDIKDMPNDKLCLVFKKGNNGEMHHIGVYIGNGKVIEAKGADYGVVETDLEGGNWTNWGVPSGLE